MARMGKRSWGHCSLKGGQLVAHADCQFTTIRDAWARDAHPTKANKSKRFTTPVRKGLCCAEHCALTNISPHTGTNTTPLSSNVLTALSNSNQPNVRVGCPSAANKCPNDPEERCNHYDKVGTRPLEVASTPTHPESGKCHPRISSIAKSIQRAHATYSLPKVRGDLTDISDRFDVRGGLPNPIEASTVQASAERSSYRLSKSAAIDVTQADKPPPAP